MKKIYFLILGLSFFLKLSLAQNPVEPVGVSSKRPSQPGAGPSKCLDNDVNTVYYADWKINAIPDTLDFVFLGAKSVNQIKYTPRATQSNGIWQKVSVYYTTVAAPSTFVLKQADVILALNNTVKTIDFASSPIEKPYIIRFVVTHSYGNFSGCAEMDFFSAETGTIAPVPDCDNPTASLAVDEKQVILSASASPAAHPGYEIEKSFDNDVNTLYSSSWRGGGFPISLTYNLTATNTVDYIIYAPRNDGNINGNFGKAEIWYRQASSGQFVKLMDFDNALGAVPLAIKLPQKLQNVSAIQIRVLNGGNNFATASEIGFYKESLAGDYPANIFTSEICVALKSGVQQSDIDAITSPFYKSLAQCMFNNTYNTKFRIQQYQPYEPVSKLWETLKVGAYSYFENPTGIAFKANSKAVIFMGATSGVLPVLKVARFGKVRYPVTATYPLKQGINIINITADGLGYIDYFSEASGLQPVTIHIATGLVNGYFDPTIDTDADWVSYLNNRAYETLDLKGKYVAVNIEKAALLKQSTMAEGGLTDAYDKLVKAQFDMMGLFKYNRVPKNKMFMYTDRGNGWFAGGQGVHLDLDWTEGIANAKAMLADNWGVSHEFGHVNQVRPGMRWHGTTEVTNNLYSAYNSFLFGSPFKNGTRLEGEERYVNYFNDVKINKRNVYEQSGVFEHLIPFWQLTLYYQLAGASKGLPTLPERVAGAPAPTGGQADVAYFMADVFEKVRATDETKMDNIDLICNWAKNTADAVQEDLSGFFLNSGFFSPFDGEVGDYGGNVRFILTQAKIDETMDYIRGKNYPKPTSPVIGYISAYSLKFFKDRLPLTGVAAVGATYDNSTKTVEVDASEWKNAVAFETYTNDKLTVVTIFGYKDASLNKTKVAYPDGSTAIYAVGYDGTRKLVYPATVAGDILAIKPNTFNGKLGTQGAVLTWAATTEHKNQYFLIEKKIQDGDFVKIAQISAKGESGHEESYEVVDPSFNQSSYYRLAEIDRDTQSTIYDDKVVFIEDIRSEVKLFPNPVGDKAYLQLSVPPKNDRVVLLDMSGRQIKTIAVGNPRQIEINTANLASGIYIVQWESATGKQSRKLIKQ